jgi:hypothetical protein
MRSTGRLTVVKTSLAGICPGINQDFCRSWLLADLHVRMRARGGNGDICKCFGLEQMASRWSTRLRESERQGGKRAGKRGSREGAGQRRRPSIPPPSIHQAHTHTRSLAPFPLLSLSFLRGADPPWCEELSCPCTTSSMAKPSLFGKNL